MLWAFVVMLITESAGRAPRSPAAEYPARYCCHRPRQSRGCGQQRVRASDTVPFALWSAAHHLDDLPGALWTTAGGLGDIDTTCAITAGVVAARTGLAGIPSAWLEPAEPLPDWTQALTSA